MDGPLTPCSCDLGKPIRDRIEKEAARKAKAAEKRAHKNAERKAAWVKGQRRAAAVPPPEPPDPPMREPVPHWAEPSSHDGH